MASLDKIKNQQKLLFNELNHKEKLEFNKKLSEEKFNNYFFISKDGKITNNIDKFYNIEDMQVNLNANKDDVKTVINASLSVIGDLLILKQLYNEEFNVAYYFYCCLNYKNLSLIEAIDYYLEKLLEIFKKEPSELVYNILMEVVKATFSDYVKIKSDFDSYVNNLSEIAEEDINEEIEKLKGLIEKEYFIKYANLIEEINQLEKPEGVVD